MCVHVGKQKGLYLSTVNENSPEFLWILIFNSFNYMITKHLKIIHSLLALALTICYSSKIDFYMLNKQPSVFIIHMLCYEKSINTRFLTNY